MAFTVRVKVLLTFHLHPSAVLLLLHPTLEWGASGGMMDEVLLVLAVACKASPFSGNSPLSSLSIRFSLKFPWHFNQMITFALILVIFNRAGQLLRKLMLPSGATFQSLCSLPRKGNLLLHSRATFNSCPGILVFPFFQGNYLTI